VVTRSAKRQWRCGALILSTSRLTEIGARLAVLCCTSYFRRTRCVVPRLPELSPARMTSTSSALAVARERSNTEREKCGCRVRGWIRAPLSTLPRCPPGPRRIHHRLLRLHRPSSQTRTGRVRALRERRGERGWFRAGAVERDRQVGRASAGAARRDGDAGGFRAGVAGTVGISRGPGIRWPQE
jgi:hypothetical protein